MNTKAISFSFCILLAAATAFAQPAKLGSQTIQINNTARAETNIQKPQISVQQAPNHINKPELIKQPINNTPQANKGILDTIKEGFRRIQQSITDSNLKTKEMQIKSRENMDRMKQMNDDAKEAQKRANEQLKRQQEEQKRLLDMQKNMPGMRR